MYSPRNNLSVPQATPLNSPQRCLLIKHSDGWHDDRCETWLHAHGGLIDTVVCHEGITLPDATNYSHVVVYGGQSCINDKNYKNCLRVEMQFIERVLENNIPCFGICLGAQLIAHVLGASVKPLECGTTEFGYSRITPTTAGKEFMPQPCNMLQWHHEGFSLPADCELLATSDIFPNQAFRYNSNTYGVQFHPEVTPEVLRVWHSRTKNDVRLKVEEMHLWRQQRDCEKYAVENAVWLEHFMQLWVDP